MRLYPKVRYSKSLKQFENDLKYDAKFNRIKYKALIVFSITICPKILEHHTPYGVTP